MYSKTSMLETNLENALLNNFEKLEFRSFNTISQQKYVLPTMILAIVVE